MKRRFLVQPDLAREVVDELFDELVVAFVDDLLQALDDLFLALHVGRREQLVFVQGIEQLVVFGRALLFDIAKLGYRTRLSGMSMRSAPARAISIRSSDVAPMTASGKQTTTILESRI